MEEYMLIVVEEMLILEEELLIVEGWCLYRR